MPLRCGSQLRLRLGSSVMRSGNKRLIIVGVLATLVAVLAGVIAGGTILDTFFPRTIKVEAHGSNESELPPGLPKRRVTPLVGREARLAAARAAAEQARLNTLTPSQLEQSKRIIVGDAGFRALVGKTRYTVVKSSAWRLPNGQRFGAVLTIRPAAPVSAQSVSLRGVRFSQRGSGYRLGQARLTVRNATELMLFVDLRTQRLLNTVFDPGAKVTAAPGTRLLPPDQD